jgi:NAD+ kinase
LPSDRQHDNSESAVAKQSIRSVGLVVRGGRPAALVIARELSGWLRGQHLVIFAEPEIASEVEAQPLTREEIAHQADLIVVLGGDGTLLGIARLVGERETPILGINLGGLGFLTEVTADEARSVLARVVAGDYEVDRRITLEAVFEPGPDSPGSSTAQRFRALNDVVVNKRAFGRMLELDVRADRQPFCAYRADGLIVATPTGSTAYALSAGGPIIFPTLGVMVLAPICPHTLSNRPVVLPDSFEIEIHVKADHHGAMLAVDGQEVTELCSSDKIRIHRCKNEVALIRSDHPYFEIWRDKLRWG